MADEKKKKNRLVEDMLSNIMRQPDETMDDLGSDTEPNEPTQEQQAAPALTEEEKMIIRGARSAKQGRPSRAEQETRPKDERRAIGVQITVSLYSRLDKALARTGQTKRDFVEGLLEREFKKLGV